VVSTADLREREIINIVDGRRLGFVADIEINLEKGKIEALIVPGQGRFLGLFGKESDYVITWDQIRKIGEDVILVELRNAVVTHDDPDHEADTV